MAAAKKKKTDMEINLDSLRKDLKAELIDLDETFEFFLTGNPMLDAFVGSGGFPKYQMEYIWGTNSIGKSTLAIQILAAYQEQHGANCVVLYFDRENSLTKQRLRNLGVDVSKVLILNPEHIEYVAETIVAVHAKYETQKVDIFAVWDTIAMTPAKEDTEGYAKIGSQARALSTMFKKMSFYDLNLTMFALNQHRETIGDKYAPKDPPGGNATKHKSFLTMNGGSKKSDVWPEGYNVGKCTTLSTVKSKIISPHRRMVFEYTFVHGYDSILTAIRYLWKELKILSKKSGRWYFAGEEQGYLLKDLYMFFMTQESIPKWKACIEGIYDTMYNYDDPIFVEEAKKRIYDYYFPKGKLMIKRNTSCNPQVVTPHDTNPIDEAALDPDVNDMLNDVNIEQTESEGK